MMWACSGTTSYWKRSRAVVNGKCPPFIISYYSNPDTFLSFNIFIAGNLGEALLYIFGGLKTVNGKYSGYKNVDVYKLHGGEIIFEKTGSDLPDTWCCGSSVTHGKNFYVVGGNIIHGSILAEKKFAYKYSIESAKWEEMRNTTEIRKNGPTMFILSDKIYAAGGHVSIKTIETLDLNDIMYCIH